MACAPSSPVVAPDGAAQRRRVVGTSRDVRSAAAAGVAAMTALAGRPGRYGAAGAVVPLAAVVLVDRRRWGQMRSSSGWGGSVEDVARIVALLEGRGIRPRSHRRRHECVGRAARPGDDGSTPTTASLEYLNRDGAAVGELRLRAQRASSPVTSSCCGRTESRPRPAGARPWQSAGVSETQQPGVSAMAINVTIPRDAAVDGHPPRARPSGSTPSTCGCCRASTSQPRRTAARSTAVAVVLSLAAARAPQLAALIDAAADRAGTMWAAHHGLQ